MKFRKIAYRQKLAFIFYEPDDFLRKVLPLLLTSFENINFVFFPEYETRGYEEPQSGYTSFEKVEIQSGVCTVDAYGNWTITMKLKNSGTATATIVSIFINDVEIDVYNSTAVVGEWTSDMTNPYSITSVRINTINLIIM